MIIKKKTNLSELCFLIFWCFLQIGKGMGYTSRDEEYTFLLLCGAPFVFFRLLLIRWNLNSLLKCICLVLLGIATMLSSGTTTYLLSLICIVAVKDIDIRKALKMTLLIRGPMFIVRTSLAIAGYLDMETMYRYTNGIIVQTRYALGYGHANTAQFEVFMLTMVFFYLYQHRLRIFHYLLAFVYNMYIYRYTDSRTCFYLCLFYIFAVYVCMNRKGEVIKRIAAVMAAKSWVIGIAITFVGCIAYFAIPEFRNFGTFSSRFLTATNVFTNYSLSIFGVADVTTDLGYVYLLFSGGVILSILFFCGMNGLQKKHIVKSDIVLLLTFACFSVFNIMESYTYSVLSNSFLLFLSQIVYSPKQRCLGNRILATDLK